MIVVMDCVFCGCEHTVETDLKAYNAWKNGKSIQRAMPLLTPTQREQLISHICPACQASIFGDEDEEFDEPADIDDDMGFDPYMGCYTYDC